MQNKIKRFSYNQLIVLQVFLDESGKVVTLKELEKKTHLEGKSLGGVISSLTRTKFRQLPLIEPMGADAYKGLRWILNHSLLDLVSAKKEVSKLLKFYS